ncbi:MAG: hypothetical protein WKF35_13855 [Ferruginibacter sp.]
MKKSLLLFLLSVTLFGNSFSQDTTAIKKNIEAATKEMSATFISRNWEEYVKYTHPAVVEMIGGKEKFVKIVSEFMTELPDSSIKFFELGKPMQLINSGHDWQTVIMQKLDIYIQGKMVRSVSYLVGESLDNGKTWTFFDSKGDREVVKKMKPDVSDKLIIPAGSQVIDENYKP